MRLAPPRGSPVAPLPRDFVSPCSVWVALLGVSSSHGIVQTTAFSLDVQWWPDGCRCLRAVRLRESDNVHHFRLMGELCCAWPASLVRRDTTDWDALLDVFDGIVDTESLTVTLPPHKRLRLHMLLSDRPLSRASASAKQVPQLVGFFMHVSFAFRPSYFFVQRMLASVGMPSIAVGADYACRMANPGWRVVFGPEVHRYHELGR